ncbi:MAG: hypothetical protein CMP51_04985 [Flavobacteriales bacterium]|nr:hypothetical protein [Flavobacteriales bacterium]
MKLKYIFKSLLFFLKLIINPLKIDVLFYYPQHFNRGKKGENFYIDHLVDTCKNSNKEILIFEEPDIYTEKIRNDNSIPFDFIYFLIIFLRKLGLKEHQIGKLMSITLLRNLKFDNVIILSQSLLVFFRHLSRFSKVFDLQHGIIYSNKENYLSKGRVVSTLLENNVQFLVYGNKFKETIIANMDNYFKQKVHVIGYYINNEVTLHQDFNHNILVTLQFTDDHTFDQNNILIESLIHYFTINNEYNFFLRDHPRNVSFDYSRLLEFPNVNHCESINIIDSFKKSSIHLTAYSTSTFEASMYGIPTIFVNPLFNDFNIFDKEYKYPVDKDLRKIILNYKNYSTLVKQWSKGFYEGYNEKCFLSAIE